MVKNRGGTPAHLTADARAMWERLTADYGIDDAAGRALLRAACEAFDRAEQARVAIEKEGAVAADRFGQMRASPWVNIERDSRTAMVNALRALHLAPGDAK